MTNLPPPPPPMPDTGHGPHAPARSGRRKRWLYGVGAGLVILGAFSAPTVIDRIGDATKKVPYYVVEPGDARPTEALIDAEDVELFDPEGGVFYTTVSVHQMTRGELEKYQRGDLDPIFKVYTEEEYLGDRTPSENRQENLKEMAYSKDFAKYVALTHLGYEVDIFDAGALVTSVVEGVPAATVLTKGDVIVELDSIEIQTGTDLREALTGREPGEQVELKVKPVDGGTVATRTIELARRDDGTGYIGITTGVPDSARFEFPIDVDIDTKQIGGPSAGLAFTLGTLDMLTPGELTGGKKVAVTGTIDINGTVGPIGGLDQKTVAARDAGADVFLVPTSEIDQALAHANDEIEIIGVANLEEALAALDGLGGNALALGTPGAQE